MRLLMLPRYDWLGASSRLRMLQYAPALRAAGMSVDISPLLPNDYVSGLYSGRVPRVKIVTSYLRRLRQLLSVGRFDVVWVEKELFPWLPAAIDLIASSKCPTIVVDYDDAVFHHYDEHRSRAARFILGSKIDKIMRRADVVTAGNEYLAQHAREAGCRRVEWLPTVVDLDRYPRVARRLTNCRVTAGWIGSPATAHYLRMIAPVLAKLTPDPIERFVAIGARPDQVEGTPFEPLAWTDESEVASLGELDIGIMPLSDAPWERGKCGYKLIQYMARALPVVASPVGANLDIVRPGENGYLAANNDEWAHALRKLAGDSALRARMGAAGRKAVEGTYSLQKQVSRLTAILASALRNRS